MKRRDAKRGIATLCLGGGNGVALAVERRSVRSAFCVLGSTCSAKNEERKNG